MGTNCGKESIAIAVDIAASLMAKIGIEPKFTITTLRDNIARYNCGSRGQSRRFNKLNDKLQWQGETVALKVPVVQKQAFSDKVWLLLKTSKYFVNYNY